MNAAPDAELPREEVLRTAGHYVHAVSPSLSATVSPMTRACCRASIFLDRRIVLPEGAAARIMALPDLRGQFPGLAGTQTRYLFHISHSGSTLLSRLLDCKPDILALREPELLRWMTDFKILLGQPESPIDAGTYNAFLEVALGLLARPPEETDLIVVKPTSTANILAQDIMAAQPRARHPREIEKGRRWVEEAIAAFPQLGSRVIRAALG